jgi:hypothetical protein
MPVPLVRFAGTMLVQTGWYTEVFVKSEESHRIKALLLSRDQLVKMKRQIYGQIRGVLRPFGIRLPLRAGTTRFDAAARAAVREDDILYACHQGESRTAGYFAGFSFPYPNLLRVVLCIKRSELQPAVSHSSRRFAAKGVPVRPSSWHPMW